MARRTTSGRSSSPPRNWSASSSSAIGPVSLVADARQGRPAGRIPGRRHDHIHRRFSLLALRRAVPVCERVRVSLKIPPSSRGFRRERGGRDHAGRARRRVLHGARDSASRSGDRADPARDPDEAAVRRELSRPLPAVRRESEWRRLARARRRSSTSGGARWRGFGKSWRRRTNSDSGQ